LEDELLHVLVQPFVDVIDVVQAEERKKILSNLSYKKLKSIAVKNYYEG